MKYGSKEDVDFYRASKFDVILISLILSFSIVSIFWITRSHNRVPSNAGNALIYQNDTLIAQAELDKNKTIALLDGKMQVETGAGKIRIIKSDCPHHICVNMGWIQYSGQVIVCVPNKVLIEIQPTNSPLLDAVSY